jgi:hypothetical protein
LQICEWNKTIPVVRVEVQGNGHRYFGNQQGTASNGRELVMYEEDSLIELIYTTQYLTVCGDG